MPEWSEYQKRLKEEFTRNRGYWGPFWDAVLKLDPHFFEAYMEFSSVPWKYGTLPPKVREFIYIAIDVATTHLYELGIHQHIANALKYGATMQEIMEIYELVSVLGIHTITTGVPILMEEWEKAGKGPATSGDLTPRQEALKEEFTRNRGYWSSLWDGVLALDPNFFEAYLKFSSIPWKYGTLEPKVRELIYIAIDASTTHLYEPGIRVHIQNALKYGATKEEIMEVFELTSVLGIHTTTTGVPILLQEWEKAHGK